jgi:hypothetical protein
MHLPKRAQKGSNINTLAETQRIKTLAPELQKSFRQIQELAAIREDYIRNKGLSLLLKHLCNKMRIYPTTVELLAPELCRSWMIWIFIWKVLTK